MFIRSTSPSVVSSNTWPLRRPGFYFDNATRIKHVILHGAHVRASKLACNESRVQITTLPLSLHAKLVTRGKQIQHGPPRRIPQKNGQKMVRRRRSRPGILPGRIKICAPSPPPSTSRRLCLFYRVAHLFSPRNFEIEFSRDPRGRTRSRSSQKESRKRATFSASGGSRASHRRKRDDRAESGMLGRNIQTGQREADRSEDRAR